MDCGLASMIERGGLPIVTSNRRPDESRARNRKNAYLPFANAERMAAAAAKFYIPSRVRSQIESDLAAIDEFQPSVVAFDFHFTAKIAAVARGIPTLSIIDPDFVDVRENSWMPWIHLRPEELLPLPSCLPSVAEVSASFGGPTIERFSDLLWGNLTLAATAHELEPLAGDRLGRLEYVGPISWDEPGFSSRLLSTRQLKIFVSAGAGAVGGHQWLRSAISGLPPDATVYFNGGRDTGVPADLSPHLVQSPFGGIRQQLQWCDLHVSHGGSSSVLATLAAGKPLVIAPTTSEQELNGRRLVEQWDAGLLSTVTSCDPLYRKLTYAGIRSGPTSSAGVKSIDVEFALHQVIERIDEYQGSALRVSEVLATASQSLSLIPQWMEEI